FTEFPETATKSAATAVTPESSHTGEIRVRLTSDRRGFETIVPTCFDSVPSEFGRADPPSPRGEVDVERGLFYFVDQGQQETAEQCLDMISSAHIFGR